MSTFLVCAVCLSIFVASSQIEVMTDVIISMSCLFLSIKRDAKKDLRFILILTDS